MYSVFSDNTGDQTGVRHIKGGIVNLDIIWRHPLFIPHFGDFTGFPFFDRDVGACLYALVDS